MVPSGPAFGSTPEYEELCLAFRRILSSLPAIDKFRIEDQLRINTDDHRPRFGRRSYAVGHGLASSDCGPELVWVGGQDCDGPWVQQAPIGSRPSGLLAAVRVASGR